MVDKLTYAGALENLGEQERSPLLTFVQADVADAGAMHEIIAREQPSVLYHLAAETHVDRSIDAPAAFIQTNVAGTASLLDAALDVWRGLNADARSRFRFVAVSTDEVFGDLGGDRAATEASPYRPNSPYAASKAAADHLCRAWYRTYGFPVILTNCSNNYGPYQFPEKFIPTVILSAMERRPIPVYGRGQNIRDWLHVDDHVAALRRVADEGEPGETYLIGARCERRNIDMVEAICAVLDEISPADEPYRKLVSYVEDRPGHDQRYAIDPGKMERELGWKPGIDLAQGVRAVVQWYVSNTPWCERAVGRAGRGRRGLGERPS